MKGHCREYRAQLLLMVKCVCLCVRELGSSGEVLGVGDVGDYF